MVCFAALWSLTLTVFGGDFQLSEIEVPIQQIRLGDALRPGKFYPQIDWERLDFNKPTIATSNHFGYVLRNARLEVVVLPSMGRIYRIADAATGHNQLWTNPIARPIKAHNDTGWWMVWGGIEFNVPRGEHGTTWSLPWQYSVAENSGRRKAVRMHVTEPATGLRQEIEVSISQDSALLTVDVLVANTTATNILFAHWTNPMLAPGGRNEVTPLTELVVPCSAMIVPDRDFTRWMGARRQDFTTNALRFVKNWPAPGDLLVEELTADFFGAFSHEANEGIVRIADRRATPGMDIWTWGYPPPVERQREYSLAPNLGYVEMWGGTARDYSDAARDTLGTRQSARWKECFVPFNGTSGLSYADTNVVIGFTWSRSTAKVTLGMFPVTPCSIQYSIKHGPRVYPEELVLLTGPVTRSFSTSGTEQHPPVLTWSLTNLPPKNISAGILPF